MDTEIKITDEKTFETTKSAVNKMVNFIKPTYGPAGNKIVIAKGAYFMVVDDGVQAARDFELPDKSENAIVKLTREVAIKTNDRVGDGTTSSLIMTQAIINEVGKKKRFNGRKIELELNKALDEVRSKLEKSAKKIVTKDDLRKVARISYDNEKIADMLADLYFKLGKDGIITIDKSPSMETTCEISEGITLDRGYLSPYMVTNPDRMETVMEKPYILLTDYRLTEASDVLPILNEMAKNKKTDLIIIAENVEQAALATLVINLPHVMNPQTGKPGVLRSVAINAPLSGEDRKVLLEDIALLTGARVFSEAKGDKLETATLADLGRATRVICRQDQSIIVGPKGNKENIQKAIDDLRSAHDLEKDEKKKKVTASRLAMFTNTVAIIKVGAPTENEQKALKYKIEDAVHAVKAAYKGGVVAGSGIALANIKTSSAILNEALKYPARQLRENMGLEAEDNLDPENVLNVVTGKTGNFMDVGVPDPVDVLIAGVESAVSIASLLITTCGMIVEYPKENPRN